MRAFIALELPRTFVEETADLALCLQSCVSGRFMPRENYHLTLAFLGDICEQEAASAMAALEVVAAQCPAVPLSCTGLGTFKGRRDSTLWMGLQPAPELLQLANRVREELGARGIAYDEKGFKPHITIARRAVIPRRKMPALGFPYDSQAHKVTLFKSELGREGATYKPLYSVELQS